MSNRYSNPCVRCGTERIIARTWKEKVGISYVFNTERVCPDKECQHRVDMANKKQQVKYDEMKLRSEQRIIARIAANKAKKAAKKISKKSN